MSKIEREQRVREWIRAEEESIREYREQKSILLQQCNPSPILTTTLQGLTALIQSAERERVYWQHVLNWG